MNPSNIYPFERYDEPANPMFFVICVLKRLRLA
jgi:hypothetical protein